MTVACKEKRLGEKKGPGVAAGGRGGSTQKQPRTMVSIRRLQKRNNPEMTTHRAGGKGERGGGSHPQKTPFVERPGREVVCEERWKKLKNKTVRKKERKPAKRAIGN